MQPDGSLLGRAKLTLSSDYGYLVAIDLDDSELKRLLAARLRCRPEATLAVLGEAILETAAELGTAQPHDMLAQLERLPSLVDPFRRNSRL